MDKYKLLIREINSGIEKFNSFFKTDFHVPLLKENELENKECYTNLTNTSWSDQRWPNSDSAGVYFIFGINQENTSEVGLYIGKASLSSKIGIRLYSHLYPYRNEENYMMNDGKGKKNILELVSSISFDENNMTFLAPALEEFLLSELREKINLLNVTGN